MADNRHTSMAFVAPHVASKYDLLPHPKAFQPHFHSCQTAAFVSQHTVLCHRGQDLFCVYLLACPPLPLCILWL